jgi:SAM-dependent methyltransferase
LGCGQGYTTNVLAASNPHIQFYANDFNPSHITGARDLANSAQLQNVHFSDGGFSEFLKRTDLPDFDYIVLHGIYSWVSTEARRDIVQFIRTKLKPGGIVYISYNCMPGWAPLLPLRRLLVEYADYQGVSRPLVPRINDSLEFVQKLVETKAMYFARDPELAKRLDLMKKHEANYMAHEYFNRDWNPFYFMDVAQELSDAKLTWVGAAGYIDSMDALQLSQEHRDLLAGIDNISFRQTVRDHILNTQFRKDIFIKGPIRLNAYETKQKWLNMRFALTDREKLSQSIKGARNSAALNPDLFEKLIAVLQQGPRTVSEMLQLPELEQFKFNNITETLTIFLEQNGCQLCLPENGQVERKRRTDLFNKVIAERARSSDDLKSFASPTTGSGIYQDRIGRLLWLAAHNQEKDWTEAVWRDMKQANLQVNKDEKPLPDAEAIVALQAHLSKLENKFIPIWKASGLL